MCLNLAIWDAYQVGLFTASVCEYASLDAVVPAFQCSKMPHADFTRDVALYYVKRGYHLLCRHAITLFLLPVGGTILVSRV